MTDPTSFYRSRMKLLASVVLGTSLLLGTAGCPNKSRNESVKLSNEGTKAYGQRQYETAIERYLKATEQWRENHVAWYGLAGAYIGKGDWAKASDAMQNAVQIAPEQAMYNMVYGYSLYNKAIETAREDQARRENKKPEEVQPDLTVVNFEKAQQNLQKAVELNPDLWRAHYYLGRIYRDTGKAKEAAEALNKALSYGPTDSAPWIALTELYRRWDYSDQAIAVATQATAVVPAGDNNYADLWYVLGMGYDDKRLDDKAIEAFTKAIDIKRDHAKSKFQRGQAYFRKGDYSNAKKDLEEFSKQGGASVEFAKQQASKMLLDIAAKSAMNNPGAGGGGAEKPEGKMTPEQMLEDAKKKKGK